MTEARWKLVVDQEGVTIANGQFKLTTTTPPPSVQNLAELTPEEAIAEVAESGQMEAVISQLQTVTRRPYGQFCGLSRALETIGERWVLLIIRDLLVRPKSCTDLRRGLPRMPASTLSARLKELERGGVVRPLAPAESPDSVVYELTPYGRELEDIVYRLSLWGARQLGEPRPEDIVTVDSLIMAMRSTFHPEAARGLRASYELHIGDIVLHACVEDGTVQVAAGRLPGADLVIEPGMALKALMAGELSPAEAISDGHIRVTGDHGLLARFAEIFYIPQPSSAAVPG